MKSVNNHNLSQDICNAFSHLDFGVAVDLDAFSSLIILTILYINMRQSAKTRKKTKTT